MPQIAPRSLRTLRERQRLSLDDLARESRVNRKTIHQIEKGKRGRTHPTTIKRLAAALKVEEDELVNATPNDEAPDDGLDKLLGRRRSQLNVRISDAKRNALSLVSVRYNVRVQEVVEIAPFLFLWAAEASLRRRRENLAELRRRQGEVSELSSSLDHLGGDLVSMHWRSVEIEQAEEKSIDDRDIFADRMKHEYRGEGGNPITQFLQGLASELGDLAEFSEWRSIYGPDYAICRDVALALVGGDEQAADDILSGDAPLHELPKELRHPKEGMAERALWVRQRAQEARARRPDPLGDLMPALESKTPPASKESSR